MQSGVVGVDTVICLRLYGQMSVSASERQCQWLVSVELRHSHPTECGDPTEGAPVTSSLRGSEVIGGGVDPLATPQP